MTIDAELAPAQRQRAVRLAVIQTAGTWFIYIGGERAGRFARQEDAVRCALEIATEVRREACPVEVLTQSRFGEVACVANANTH